VVTVAGAYRLLHAIMETAVDDELIRRNPCRIDGAAKEESDERALIPLPVVFPLADTLPLGTAPWCCSPPLPSNGWANSRASPETASTSAAARFVLQTPSPTQVTALSPFLPRSCPNSAST
jgi:hypothetical protein